MSSVMRRWLSFSVVLIRSLASLVEFSTVYRFSRWRCWFRIWFFFFSGLVGEGCSVVYYRSDGDAWFIDLELGLQCRWGWVLMYQVCVLVFVEN